MSIPNFTEKGLLPKGVHSCSLDEAREYFATNTHRKKLWEDFLRFLKEIKNKGLTGDLFIDGSFVTDKEEPNDIEVTLDVKNESVDQQKKAIIVFCLHHNSYKQDYNVDFYPTLPSQNDFTLFFQYVGEKTAATKQLSANDLKGILKVERWNKIN